MNRSHSSDATRMVEYEIRSGVAWIFLNRPEKLNAVNPQLVIELIESLETASRNNVNAVVLAGRGDAFCSGYDLTQENGIRSEVEHRQQIERLHDVTRIIRMAPFAVVASVHGYALGNGCEFALACDFIVAADDVQFGFPEVQWGLGVTGGLTALLAESVGLHVAKSLILGTKRFSAGYAQELGLVSLITTRGELEDVTAEFAQGIASLPRNAFSRTKRLLNQPSDSALEIACGLETVDAIAAQNDPQTKKHVDYYAESRRP